MHATDRRNPPIRHTSSEINLPTVDTRPARATLTKRHFIAIAKVLAEHESKGNTDDVARRCIARDLASYFNTQNPLFDRSRFLTAAKVE